MRIAALLLLLWCVAPPRACADDVDSALYQASVQTGVPLKLLRALSWEESRHNPRSVSPVGAKGLLQLMPCILRWQKVQNAFDPHQNAMAGAKFLRLLRHQFKSWRRALAAYNWGPGNVRRSKTWPACTQRYVRSICKRSGAC